MSLVANGFKVFDVVRLRVNPGLCEKLPARFWKFRVGEVEKPFCQLFEAERATFPTIGISCASDIVVCQVYRIGKVNEGWRGAKM